MGDYKNCWFHPSNSGSVLLETHQAWDASAPFHLRGLQSVQGLYGFVVVLWVTLKTERHTELHTIVLVVHSEAVILLMFLSILHGHTSKNCHYCYFQQASSRLCIIIIITSYSRHAESLPPRVCLFILCGEMSRPAGRRRSWSPNSPHSLFTLTQSWWWERGPSSSPHLPTHHLITSSTWWAHFSFLPLSTFIYIFIYFTPAWRVTVFNIIGETWLLPLNAEITGAFFLSSSPLHFSRVAPRGRNIFISSCAPSFKTFTPAVWKIFLIFLPHGVEKSP